MKTEPTNDDRILSVADLFLSLSIFKKVQVWQPPEKETDTHTHRPRQGEKMETFELQRHQFQSLKSISARMY